MEESTCGGFWLLEVIHSLSPAPAVRGTAQLLAWAVLAQVLSTAQPFQRLCAQSSAHSSSLPSLHVFSKTRNSASHLPFLRSINRNVLDEISCSKSHFLSFAYIYLFARVLMMIAEDGRVHQVIWTGLEYHAYMKNYQRSTSIHSWHCIYLSFYLKTERIIFSLM